MCPDASFVLVNDSLHGGQADSCPFEFFSAAEPLKRTKELLGALRIETYVVVPHRDGSFAIDEYLADLDDGGIARPPAPDLARFATHEDTCLYFGCPDVDAAYAYLRARGVAAKEPHVAPYGMKQLYLSDPDGYSICFQWPAK